MALSSSQSESPTIKPLELWTGQRRLLEDREKKYHAVVAGVRYGKTVFGARWVVSRALINSKSKQALVVAPKFDLLKQVNFPAVIEVLTHYRIPYKANFSDLYIDLPWGLRILFRSAETWRRIVGYTVAFYWLDEPGLCPAEVDIELNKRLSCPFAKLLQGLYTGTPEGINHYAKAFGMGAVEKDGPRHSVGADRIVLHGKTYDNNLLPAGYVDQLYKAFDFNPNFIKSYIEGEFCALYEDTAFDFDPARNVSDCKPRDSIHAVWLTWDFNVGQVSWSALQQWDGKHHLVKENKRKCRDTWAGCDNFIAAFPPTTWKHATIYVTGDASGWGERTSSSTTDYDIIETALRPHYKSVVILAPRSNPSIRPSIIGTNRLLARAELLFDRDCPWTIESAQSVVFDGKGGIEKPSDDQITHPMDNVRYYVEATASDWANRLGVNLRW